MHYYNMNPYKMNEDIIIREGRPEDAEALLAFLNIVGAETDNMTFGSEGFPFSLEDERAYLKRMHEDEHSVSMLAFCGDRIIGDASISGMSRRMSHRAELGISVLREFWSRGVGSLLLESVISYARSHGIEFISLEVRSDNERAIRLYERYGFVKSGTWPAYFRIGDDYIDFDIMYLDLRDPQ